MKSGDNLYVWQHPDWPQWRYQAESLMPLLAQVHQSLGHLMGRMRDQGMPSQDHANLEALTTDVLKTSEIEGEQFDAATVRSSIARRLGVDVGALMPADRHVDGVVEMILDATSLHATPLTAERLAAWHAALFPTRRSGLASIRVGTWRDDAEGPMQVVSGPMHRRRVHYEAPPAHRLPAEIADFLVWFESAQAVDPLIKAGLAHLWFVTLHPFDDGNGRIARAIGDMALARADQSKQRFYSLSAQIQKERKDYYDLLEKTQKGNLEATEWLSWFLSCLLRALQEADQVLTRVLMKANFWRQWAGTPLSERQVKVLNRMLDGFDGKLSNKKWAAMGKCSSDTALRDINDLVARGVLRRTQMAGRSTSYELNANADGVEKGFTR
jgi:Fic family protein